MRDDIALFHLKQNQRNNFSLSSLLFVANSSFFLLHFIFSLSRRLLFFNFHLFARVWLGYCCDANTICDMMTKPFELCS